jgi:histidine triad (HIT) family protein
MNGCIFCKIVKGEKPCYKVFEDEKFLAFLDINPIAPGHLVIIPKRHESYVFSLDNVLYGELFLTAKKLAGPLQKITQSKRVGLAIEGFGVDHIHLHLVPINKGNDLDPHRAKHGDPDELAALTEVIKKAINEVV